MYRAQEKFKICANFVKNRRRWEHLEDLESDKKEWKFIVNKWGETVRTARSWLRTVKWQTSEESNDISGSLRGEINLD